MSVKRKIPQAVDSLAKLNFPRYLLSVSAFAFHSPLPGRFLTKIAFKSTGCWEWIGATGFHPKYRQHRYGQFVVWTPGMPTRRECRKMTSAHRFAYEATFGPIAKEIDVDHLCNNKLCVNPEHLEAVTHQENCRRRKPVTK